MNEWEWQVLEEKTPVDRITLQGGEVQVGDRVRLRPRQRGDIFDLALVGQVALVDSLEQDYEGKVHVCVVLDDDPGRDLGLLRQPGHRFFFDVEEIELLPPGKASRTPTEAIRILVAGIGNIFLGDDGFGVEVVRRLSVASLPRGVRVADFGIRGIDLAYALQDGYETIILIDAYPHGQPAGTVSLIEPELDKLDVRQAGVVDAHGMNPLNVLAHVKGTGAKIGKVLLIGCEPATLGGEDGAIGLSDPVEAGVNEAVQMISPLVAKILQEGCDSKDGHNIP